VNEAPNVLSESCIQWVDSSSLAVDLVLRVVCRCGLSAACDVGVEV